MSNSNFDFAAIAKMESNVWGQEFCEAFEAFGIGEEFDLGVPACGHQVDQRSANEAMYDRGQF